MHENSFDNARTEEGLHRRGAHEGHQARADVQEPRHSCDEAGAGADMHEDEQRPVVHRRRRCGVENVGQPQEKTPTDWDQRPAHRKWKSLLQKKMILKPEFYVRFNNHLNFRQTARDVYMRFAFPLGEKVSLKFSMNPIEYFEMDSVIRNNRVAWYQSPKGNASGDLLVKMNALIF